MRSCIAIINKNISGSDKIKHSIKGIKGNFFCLLIAWIMVSVAMVIKSLPKIKDYDLICHYQLIVII
jgi:hypothetical protein